MKTASSILYYLNIIHENVKIHRKYMEGTAHTFHLNNKNNILFVLKITKNYKFIEKIFYSVINSDLHIIK